MTRRWLSVLLVVTGIYPAAEDQVLWLDLDRGVLRDSRTFSDAQALRQALEQAQ